jgi:hypothetical protein
MQSIPLSDVDYRTIQNLAFSLILQRGTEPQFDPLSASSSNLIRISQLRVFSFKYEVA